MIIQKNKIIAIYLFIYIFLYIVCVSLEQYMQQPLNGVTSYWAAKLWGRGNKLQAGEGNQQKQVLRHEFAPFSKPPERGMVGYSCGMGIPRCPYFLAGLITNAETIHEKSTLHLQRRWKLICDSTILNNQFGEQLSSLVHGGGGPAHGTFLLTLSQSSTP